MNLFLLCFRLHRFLENKLKNDWADLTYKQRAVITFCDGIAKAGVYWFS